MSGIPDPQADRNRVLRLISWVVWVAILAGLVLLYAFLARGPETPGEAGDLAVNLAGLAPLIVSIVIRWLVLPRFSDPGRALPIYVAGMALAEACGILGIFLGGSYRDDLFLLGVLGVTQYMPFLLPRHPRPDKGQFIPNN